MNKYIAINIGPIIATFSLAKKPRELWSASYMFSLLMKRIIEKLSEKAILLSPCFDISDQNLKNEKVGVGLYPDRAFFKLEKDIETQSLIDEAVKTFAADIEICLDQVKDYFNIMVITMDACNDSEAIKYLNEYLNYLELNNSVLEGTTEKQVLQLIKNRKESPLYKYAFPEGQFFINTLAEIGAVELSFLNKEKWTKVCQEARISDCFYEMVDEDNFHKYIKPHYLSEYKSYHKYICIVQADGDSMGAVVTHLPDGEIANLSKKIMTFGIEACDCIKDFGGLPIYAGGDDLLFIAPVVGKDQQTIFELLEKIDKKYTSVITMVEDYELYDKNRPIQTSMSYGVSMSYYKFPLYEAWASARELLFEKAKKVNGKNAIAWKLQKHSGTSFTGMFSKKDDAMYNAFKELVNTTTNERIVSAVAHKIRENEGLLALWIGKDQSVIGLRLKSFFLKVMDYMNKKTEEQVYLDAVRELLILLYEHSNIRGILTDDKLDESEKMKRSLIELIQITYGMLRTAKFIKGEEDKQ